jgi:hypothetical protein
MVIGLEFFTITISRQYLRGIPNISFNQQIDDLREDRLSGKKSIFAHANLVKVVLTKLAGGNSNQISPLLFTGQQ